MITIATAVHGDAEDSQESTLVTLLPSIASRAGSFARGLLLLAFFGTPECA